MRSSSQPSLAAAAGPPFARRYLRLLVGEYCTTLQSMADIDQRRAAAAWRRIVETWLRRQGLIIVGNNQQPDKNVVPIFSKKMVSQLGLHYIYRTMSAFEEK